MLKLQHNTRVLRRQAQYRPLKRSGRCAEWRLQAERKDLRAVLIVPAQFIVVYLQLFDAVWSITVLSTMEVTGFPSSDHLINSPSNTPIHHWWDVLKRDTASLRTLTWSRTSWYRCQVCKWVSSHLYVFCLCHQLKYCSICHTPATQMAHCHWPFFPRYG